MVVVAEVVEEAEAVRTVALALALVLTPEDVRAGGGAGGAAAT